jgi:CheY-like chemotaxis protein
MNTETATPHVLVVDDDPDCRALLAALLRDVRFEVVSANDGQDALEKLRSASALPFLILLDLTMPVMDGETFRRHQLEDPALATIRTVVMSAVTGVGDTAQRMGVEALQKPVDIDRILTLAQQCLARAA